MCLGLELTGDYAMISSFVEGMDEPKTSSLVAGSEHYQIPLMLCKRQGIGQWFYGEEGQKLAKTPGYYGIFDLYNKALNREQIRIENQDYDCVELFGLLLSKIISLPRQLGQEFEIAQVAVTIQKLTENHVEVLVKALEYAGIRKKKYVFMDKKESFYYYALSQKEDLYIHDVALFDLNGGALQGFCLHRNTKTTPQMVEIEETDYGMLYENRDAMFLQCVEELFSKRIITTSYLTGEGFEGDWMKDSLRLLCRGKKAFAGKNLFSKGACYGAMVHEKLCPWNFVYMGENEWKVNVGLQVQKDGEGCYESLLNAGDNWYEASGRMEVILDGKPEISLFIQDPMEKEPRVETLTLEDFPEREEKTTRLRIWVKPVSDCKMKVQIRDLGFGEIVKASEKVWEYMVE